MTLQTLLELACRHETAMADAMVAAVVAKAQETGERLENVPRRRLAETRHELTIPYSAWRRYVERNSDTRWNHV